MDDFAITVKIAGRAYKLIIQRDEEESVREAAKRVDEQIKTYASNYNSDKQDILAMVALHFATMGLRTGSELAYVNGSMGDDLAVINNVLENALKD
jgi:cell division protein ZapA